jgi:Tol biopolymer transport system component/predicted Ser/Thr protein kinase
VQAEVWKKVEKLFLAAKDYPVEKRAEFLEHACPDDAEIRAEVQALLDAESSAASFLESSPLASRLAPGTKLGHFEIQQLLGRGGMGEVYRARDSRLNRTIAIKILPRHLSGQLDLRERFEREARAISALNHPHICTLYDVGREDGLDFLAMEYLDGETLEKRLARGALPIDQVLRYAAEVADALVLAHRQGVLHRDLKPSNIMLTKSGAKVLDFGLAKVQAVKSGAGITRPASTLTEEGVILGTLQYMAPEQLEGKDADARTDIFAFGTVLYEMAAGQKTFKGESRASLIAAILEHEPEPLTALKPMIPAAVERVVTKALAKDPDARWQSSRDLKDELEWIAGQRGAAATIGPHVTKKAGMAWLAAGIFAAAAIVYAFLYFRERPAEQQLIRFSIAPPERVVFSDPFAISPDGTRLALIASVSGGEPSIWVHRLDSINEQALPGTEGAEQPFWSPDSESIAFFAQGELKRVEISSGSVQTLCHAPGDDGGTWNRDGIILFTHNQVLYKVAAGGGSATPVTQLNPGNEDVLHLWPQFLPDGQHFLYSAQNVAHRTDGIYVGALDSKETKRILDTHWMAVYVPSSRASQGYLLFVRNGNLMAQQFDTNRYQLLGNSVPVAEGAFDVQHSPEFTASVNGILAYRPVGSVKTQLTWFDRSGKALGKLGLTMQDADAAISPDGRRVAVSRASTASENSQITFNGTPTPNDIWVLELKQGIASRLTFDSSAGWPIWSPDGTHVAFASNRDGVLNIYQKPANGAGTQELLLNSSEDKAPSDWSRDGRFLAYSVPKPTTFWDIWVLPVTGDKAQFPFVQTQFSEGDAKFSPDGRWVVYQSNESGEWAVYVRPFDTDAVRRNAAFAGKWRISEGEGHWPRWAKGGNEILYLGSNTKVMAVDVNAKSSDAEHGPTFDASVPKLLFNVSAYGLHSFTATADGQRFLINTKVGEEKSPSVTVVLNWPALLKQAGK